MLLGDGTAAGRDLDVDDDRADDGGDGNLERAVARIDGNDPAAVECLTSTECLRSRSGRHRPQRGALAQMVGNEDVNDVSAADEPIREAISVDLGHELGGLKDARRFEGCGGGRPDIEQGVHVHRRAADAAAVLGLDDRDHLVAGQVAVAFIARSAR